VCGEREQEKSLRERERCKLVPSNITGEEIRPGYLNGTDPERELGRGIESVLKRTIPESVPNGDVA
jgi:hypothetical protein